MNQNSVPMIGVKTEQDKHFEAQKAAGVLQYKMNSKTNAMNAALSLAVKGPAGEEQKVEFVDQCEKIYQWLLRDIE